MEIELRVPADFTVDDGFSPWHADDQVTFLLDWQIVEHTVLLGDAWVIQRFLTAIFKTPRPRLVWSEKALETLKTSPGAVALLACAIHLDRVINVLADGSTLSPQRQVALQQSLAAHRLKPNWFEATDSVICSGNKLRGWHKDFYSTAGQLRPRDEIARILNSLIESKVTGLPSEELVLKWKDSLASVIYELFENTHIHARFDYDRIALASDNIRLVTVRLVTASTGGNPTKIKTNKSIECLEISVIDSGVGFFGSRLKRPLFPSDELKYEWENVRMCLDKHIDDEPLQHTHRGLGLYEVLRALHFLNGAIQVRSGRIFGYRSFFPFDHRQQMEAIDSKKRPGMPKGRLLDYNEPYRPSPTANSEVRGVAVRTLVPLSWE